MNNILMHASITELTNTGVECFLEKHRDDNIVLIYEMLEDCDFHPELRVEVNYLTDKMRAHDFRSFEEYASFEPVDPELLHKMSKYEGEIYKMMDTYFPPLKTFDERQRVYYEALRFFRGILKKYKIELYIEFGIPHQVYDFIIYCLCKCLNIQTYLIYRMPVRGYIYFFNDIENHGKYFRPHGEACVLSPDFERSFYNYTHSEDGVKLHYMPGKSIQDRLNVFRNRFNMLMRYENHFSNFRTILNLQNRKRKIDRLINALQCNDPDIEARFLYVGLHYQPEGTTSPMAGVFVNQQIMIEMLSYYVPDNLMIFVKEHPNQNLRGEKNIDFFSEISKLRNVKIIPTNYSSNLLEKKCVAVVTCTGTVAYEAAYIGKPVLLFGHYLYNYMPNCYTINSNEDCKYAITQVTNHLYSFDEESMRKFLKELDSVSYHAEFALGEKDYMISSGLSLSENNSNIERLLHAIYTDYGNNKEYTIWN